MVDKTQQNQRLMVASLCLCAYVCVVFLLQAGIADKVLARAQYSSAVATLPQRLVAPSRQSELTGLINILRELEEGGQIPSLGLRAEYPPLAELLLGDLFDMSATVELLQQGRVRAARAKIELLSSKLQRNQSRQLRLFGALLWLSLLGALCLTAYIALCWWRARAKLNDEISPISELPESQMSLTQHLHKVLDEEIAFTGYHARLNTAEIDEGLFNETLAPALFTICEQLLRNSLEHGGRAADLRVLAGKPEFMTITVSLKRTPQGIELVVHDDGEGIDEKQVLQRAVELRLISLADAAKTKPGHGIKYIFSPGYSEAKPHFGVADNSIGLDRLRHIAAEHGGAIKVRNLAGKMCQISILFKPSH